MVYVLLRSLNSYTPSLTINLHLDYYLHLLYIPFPFHSLSLFYYFTRFFVHPFFYPSTHPSIFLLVDEILYKP